jgi:hypothetical protein
MDDTSIHPDARRPVKNTSKPYKRQGKGKLGSKQRLLNMRRNAHSATLADPHVKHKQGFKTPGSMK